MKISEQELAAIRGLIHLAKEASLPDKSRHFSEITERIKKLLETFELRRKRNLQPLFHALLALHHSLEKKPESSVPMIRDLAMYNWALDRLDYYIDHWDNLT